MRYSLLLVALAAIYAQPIGAPAGHVLPVSALPATCNPATGDVAALTTGGSKGFYSCTATNTWTYIGGGGGGVTVSPPYITVAGAVYGPVWAMTQPPASGWTFDNQGGSTASTANGDLLITWASAGADNLRSYNRTAPGTFTVTAAFYPGFFSAFNTNGNSSGHGITVGDGTKYIHFELVSFSSQVGVSNTAIKLILQKWTNTTTASSAYNVIGDWALLSFAGRPVWERLQLDATNLTWSYSLDGLNWVQFDQRPKGDFLGTITTVGLGSYVNTGGSTAVLSWAGV